MPNRIIREGINSSPRVNALSQGGELFYRRLMTVVDDYGRYHGSVVVLRGACWPTNPERISEKEVGKWLNELLRGDDPLVKTYNVAGAVYIEVQDFGQRTRSESKFPSPPWQQIDRALTADCGQVADNPPPKIRPMRNRISETECGVRVAPPPAAREHTLEMPRIDYGQRFDALYAKHPAPGYKEIGRTKYLEILSRAVDLETVASAIDREHAAWCDFWRANPTERVPTIGYYFEDEVYLRKPSGRARDAPGPRPATVDRALLAAKQRAEEMRQQK